MESTSPFASWQIPRHEVMSFSARSHDHALVIPVINEGERIRDQLMRIQALCPRVDIVIADGGSTDDSVRPEFLRSVGVRACLVKRDRGKLSAQLRMGYAWCLTEGYQGIVTIDGNGKDDVAAIADFVSRLEDGFDYVQGSRYRPGGARDQHAAGTMGGGPTDPRADRFARCRPATYRHHQRISRLFQALPARPAGCAFSRDLRSLCAVVLSVRACRTAGLSHL